MRIATWNVNSLAARLDKVAWWLERARPDVLLLQETKLADRDAPVARFGQLGYASAMGVVLLIFSSIAVWVVLRMLQIERRLGWK